MTQRPFQGSVLCAASLCLWLATLSPPSLAQQEPRLQASRGTGDVIPGTLLHSGEVTRSEIDVSLPGRGIPVVFRRTYRSQGVGSGPLGPGWDHNYRMRLRALPNGDVELFDGTGRRELFRRDASGGLRAPAGWFVELKQVRSSAAALGYELTMPDHSIVRFDGHGRMVSLRDAHKVADAAGNEILFRYDASDRLIAIEDDLGQLHRLTYDAEGRLTRFTDATGREWKYGYNANGLLETVTSPSLTTGESKFPGGLVTRYEYTAPTGSLAERLTSRDNLRSVTDARGVRLVEWDYTDADGDGRAEEVTTERWGGKSLSITYRFATRETDVRDRRGALTTYRHDADGHLVGIVDPTGAVTAFTLDAEGLVTEARSPQGRRTVTTYDTLHGRRARGNAIAVEVFADSRGPNGSGPVLRSTAEYEGYSNQPTKMIDPRGAITHIVRGDTGLALSITEADGAPEAGTTRFEYDAYGRLTQSVDPTGRVVEFGYGAGVAGRGQWLRELQDPAGLRIESLVERNTRGEVIATVDPRGVRHEIVRNELGWVVEERQAVTGSSDGAPALGYVTKHLHDALGQVIESRLPFGDDASSALFTRVLRTFGVAGELLAERREVTPNVGDFVETTSTYDDRFQPELLTGPEGQVTRHTYDDRGLLISVLRGSGTPDAAETTFEYDAEGQRTTSTDGRGKIWTTRYDGFGRTKEVVDPLGNLARVSYDAAGNPTSQESLDAAAAVLARARTAFDLRGRPFEARQALFTDDATAARDLLTRQTFDAAGRVLTAVDPKGRTTTLGYDSAGRSNFTVDPVQNRIESTLDAAGNAVAIKTVESLEGGGSAEVTETAKFDALGRRTEARDGLGNPVGTIYDVRGNVRKTIDAEGFFTDIEYDGLGRPTRETKPEGIEVTFGYDRASRLTSYVDALGNTTTWTYDALDRQRSIRYADQTTEQVAYDDNDNVLETIDARGNKIQWTYDDAGRLTARQLTTRAPGVPGPASESHQYDGLGRLVSSQRGTQLVERRYDSLSRLLRDQQGANAVLFQLDDAGNPEEITYPSGYKLAQAFDAANRLTSIQRGATQLAGFGYRGFGLPTSVTLPGLTGTMSYDGARRRTATSYGVPGGPERFSETAAWSPRDLKTASTRSDQNQTARLFGYDGARRLTDDVRQKNAPPANNAPPDLAALRQSAERKSFVYDVAQNLLNQQQTSSSILESQRSTPNDASGRNRPGSVDGTPLAWDASGNLASKGARQYLWDAWGRLAEVKENDSTVATYRYDAFNRLVEKETSSGVETTIYSGWNPVERYANGQLQSRRVYGEGLDSLVRQEVDQDLDGQLETSHSPIFDSAGSVAMLVSDTGQIVETYKVDGYGGVKSYVDSTRPAIHQIAEDAAALQLLLSEEADPARIQQAIASGTLELVRTSDGSSLPLTLEVPPQSEGVHTWRIRLTPSSAIAAAVPVELRIGEGVFVDGFGNESETVTQAFTWPAAGAIVEDTAAPSILAVRVRANRIEVALSEAADTATLAEGLKVDGASATWTASEGGLLLTSGPVSTGSHTLEATAELHDRASTALGNANSWAFTGSIDRIVYRLPDPRETEASAAGNRFVFHGRDFDADAGLVYFRNRWLDPGSGRFIGRDPLGFVDGPSPYGFALNNPVGASDPLGLSGDWAIETRAAKNAEAYERQQRLYREWCANNPVACSRKEARESGVLRAVGGLAQCAGGAAAVASPSGVGQVVGAAALARCADNVATGVKQAWTGEEQRSGLGYGINRAALAMGANEREAAFAEGTGEFLTDVGSGLVAARAVAPAKPLSSALATGTAEERPIIVGRVLPYDQSRKARIPGYDEHHLDPPLGRRDPGYATGPTMPVRNDNAGGRVSGGENWHTGPGGFQQSLNQHIQELGYSRQQWNALPTGVRQLHLRRYYASLGIPFPAR